MPQIIEVPGMGQVEFPDGMSDDDISAAIRKNMPPTQPQQASLTDRALGSGVGRTLLGIATPVLGIGQAAAHLTDPLTGLGLGPKADAALKEIEASKRRGMERAGENIDVAGVFGQGIGALAPAGAVTKVLGRGAGPVTRALIGGTQGAVVAGATPTKGEDFGSEKTSQMVTGGALGGLFSLGSDVVRGAGRVIDIFKPYFQKEGYKELAKQAVVKNVGKENLRDVVAASMSARSRLPAHAPASGAQGPVLPGSPMTAAEAVSRIPQGSPVQAMQKLTYTTPGGPSKLGGELARNAIAAQEAGKKIVEAQTAPLRTAALEAANRSGQLRISPIVRGLDAMLKDPEVYGSPTTKKAIVSVGKALEKMAAKNKRIDANALYAFKREGVNQVIDDVFKQADPKIGNEFKARHLIKVKGLIDDAIEGAGGATWKQYLKEYSKGMQNIQADIESKEAMYKPLQKTMLQKGSQIARGEIPLEGGPPLLHRAYTFSKWVPRARAEILEPKIDAYLADLFSDSGKFGQAMSAAQQASHRQKVIEALMRQAPVAAGVIGGQVGR